MKPHLAVSIWHLAVGPQREFSLAKRQMPNAKCLVSIHL